MPGYAANTWWGIMAPAGTPQPIVEKLYKNIPLALQSPEMQQAFAREGAACVTMSSAEFADFIKTEIAKWGRVVKEGHITAH